MKHFITTILIISILQIITTPPIIAQAPRIIVMTDGEVDDQASMVRFLLYSCHFDIEAIIETNSKWQRYGHSKEDWYENMLDAYEDVRPNLLLHHPGYPTAEFLRSISYLGDEDSTHLDTPRSSYKPGQTQYRDPSEWADTPGSDKIIEILLEDNPAPIIVQVWGGANTLSRALYKLQRDYPDQYEQASRKVTTYNIDYQDGAGTYIEQKHPFVTQIVDWGFVGTWNYVSQTDTYDFIERGVKNDHGPLGALYALKYVSEGDSPAFLYCLPNGLRSHEHPTHGGWGGRFKSMPQNPRVYLNAHESGSIKQSHSRWVRDANADFLARMDWCVSKRYQDANHAPRLKVNTEIDMVVTPGEPIGLSVEGTKDPDGDLIDLNWLVYEEAGTYKGQFPISYQEGYVFKAVAPQVQRSETIHIIVEASDYPTKGPGLKSYQRFIITVNPF